MQNLTLISLALILLTACNTPKKETEENTDQSEEIISAGITLTKAPQSPDFLDSKLTKISVDITESTDSTNVVDYTFAVENYELGIQTPDANSRGLANSGKGQHIHFIVNNGSYSAHYMPEVSNELATGSYTVLAFLSRSYHESVKSTGAYYVENLNVGNADQPDVDLDAPHMFFSRPKGTYKGDDTKKLMLDFYLINADCSANGNSIKATINGEEFLIDEWTPYYIEGLPMGKVNIKLEFLNADGELVDSPFNPVERTVTLTK